MLKQNRHPLNAEGKFWVDQDTCLACDTCRFEAPNNFGFDIEIGSSYYVSKQPENEEELKAMKEAIFVCAVEAIMED